MHLPVHADVVAARARIAPFIVRTPMLRHRELDARTSGTILVKPEPLQRTGSFKLRGATNAIQRLGPAAQRGVSQPAVPESPTAIPVTRIVIGVSGGSS